MEKLLYVPNNSINNPILLMAYPACEAFALSSLGYLWLSKMADEYTGINIERFYTDSENSKLIFAKSSPNLINSLSFKTLIFIVLL